MVAPKLRGTKAEHGPPMPNKRFQDTQDAGERTRKLRENLTAFPVSPQEAARIVCEMHTGVDGDRVRVNFMMPPDFTKVDGNIYHEAWRKLREFAGLG